MSDTDSDLLSGVWSRARQFTPTWNTPNSCSSVVCLMSATSCRRADKAAPQVGRHARNVTTCSVKFLTCHIFILDVLDEDKFNVELVVQCIRASDMPQTHHHALLLLGTAAAIFPVSDVTSLLKLTKGFIDDSSCLT